MAGVPASPGTRRRAADVPPFSARALPWVMVWAGATLGVAAVATAFDAFLLQYRRSYFTGGFLARDYLTTVSEAGAFFAGSLVTDAAAAGVIACGLLWLFGRLGVRLHVALPVTCILTLTPAVVANFIEYQLGAYLGDAFDVRLLFDLSGRSPGEFIAVSAAHIWRMVWLGLGVGGPLAVVLWIALRRGPHRTGAPLAGPTPRAMLLPVALFLVGTVVMTAVRNGSDVLDNGLRRKPAGRLLGLMVETASDVDNDGFGILGRPDDPRLFDGRVQPYALDVPGNGVDEDGVAGDLPATAAAYEEDPTPATPWRSKPDIVLVVLESFRADVLGARLGGRPVTPVLDGLAGRGIAARHAYSHNGYTVQSRRHIFSGSIADIAADTLIDDFKRQGYEVAYFSGQDESFGGPRQGVGFDRADVAYDARADRERRYSDFSTAGSLAVPYDVVQERVGEFLRARHGDKPLFLYVNFHDTHFPYHHRAVRPLVSSTIVEQFRIAPDRTDDVRAMYMNTASNVDRAIGGVLADVAQAVGREPGVVVLSDHGESLFDEGFLGHGYALNDAQTRIPLVVANLPLVLREPFAQSDLRGALAQALQQGWSGTAVPVITTGPRNVFQYLGLIQRPAQIAFTGVSGRTIYDFREGRARIGNGDWRHPGELDAPERAAVMELVQTWERMMLARRAAATDKSVGLALRREPVM